MSLSTEEMTEIITAELQMALLRPKLGPVAARVAATHLVKRLHMQGIRWSRRPPPPLFPFPIVTDNQR